MSDVSHHVSGFHSIIIMIIVDIIIIIIIIICCKCSSLCFKTSRAPNESHVERIKGCRSKTHEANAAEMCAGVSVSSVQHR